MSAARTVSAVLCAAICCALVGYAVGSADAHTGLRNESVSEVLLSGDGRTLSASASGTCLPATELFAREQRDSVTVALATVPRVGGCFSGMETRTWSTTLASPLGQRRVFDLATGRGVPVFDEADLLRPTTLPAGYVHIYDAAMYADDDGGGSGSSGASVGPIGSTGSDWDASCAQLFADAQGDQLWISQSYGTHWPDGWGPTLPLLPVRHALARYKSGMLAWQEHGQSFTILSLSALDAPAPLPASQLAAVAQGLTGDEPVHGR